MASPTTTSAPCPPNCSSRSADRPKTRTSRCSWRSRSVTLLPTFPDAPITAIIPTSSLSITFHPALHPANAPAEVHHVIRTTPKPLVKESPRPQPSAPPDRADRDPGRPSPIERVRLSRPTGEPAQRCGRRRQRRDAGPGPGGGGAQLPGSPGGGAEPGPAPGHRPGPRRSPPHRTVLPAPVGPGGREADLDRPREQRVRRPGLDHALGQAQG